MMAALRALLIFLALAAFFLIGTPIQWVIARLAPGAAHRIPTLFCRSILRLLNVEISIEGTLPTGVPVLVAANHVSWIDILTLGALQPFCFLAKAEVGAWPVLSAFAKVQGTVFVDRKRRRSIVPANRALAERMRQGRAVLLFPEGTTVEAREPGPFRSSHFAAARDLLRASCEYDHVAVQPVALAYSSSAAAWVGDAALLPHLWRTLRGPRLLCRIVFAPPLAYRVGSGPKEIAQAARSAVTQALGRARSVEATVSLPAEALAGRVRTAS